jgi:hypothetical protein
VRLENFRLCSSARLIVADAGEAARPHPEVAAARTADGKTVVFSHDDADSPFMKDALKALRRGVSLQLEAWEVRPQPPCLTPPHRKLLVQRKAAVCGSSGKRDAVGRARAQRTKLEKSAPGVAQGDSGGAEEGCSDGDYSVTLDMSAYSEPGSEGPAAAGGGEAGQAGQAGQSRPVQFVAHHPRVFACVREGLNLPEDQYRAAFAEAAEGEGFRALRPTSSKSGRFFYMTPDERFVLKSLTRDEARPAPRAPLFAAAPLRARACVCLWRVSKSA